MDAKAEDLTETKFSEEVLMCFFCGDFCVIKGK